MAEADIAYVATAGAAGLALALSAWAARLRGRLAARNQVAETALAAALVDLADRDGALAAFEDVRLAGIVEHRSYSGWRSRAWDMTEGIEASGAWDPWQTRTTKNTSAPSPRAGTSNEARRQGRRICCG